LIILAYPNFLANFALLYAFVDRLLDGNKPASSEIEKELGDFILTPIMERFWT
jgi:hypothetical protein